MKFKMENCFGKVNPEYYEYINKKEELMEIKKRIKELENKYPMWKKKSKI